MTDQAVQQRGTAKPDPASSRAAKAGPADVRLARTAAVLNAGAVHQLAPKKKLAPLAPKTKLAQLVVQRTEEEERSHLHHFGSGLHGGITGFFQSLNIAAQGNPAAARTQLGQLGNVVRNPGTTAATVWEGVQPHLGDIDPGRTAARTAGDVIGGAAALMGTTALTALALRRPYLASRFGTYLMHRWRTAAMLQHPFLQRPRVANFAVTRPLSAMLGLGLGAASFYGSAGTRASDAEENRDEHPELHEALRRAQLDQLLGSQLNRAIRRPRNGEDE
jgi:hypothetical protein